MTNDILEHIRLWLLAIWLMLCCITINTCPASADELEPECWTDGDGMEWCVSVNGMLSVIIEDLQKRVLVLENKPEPECAEVCPYRGPKEGWTDSDNTNWQNPPYYMTHPNGRWSPLE